MEPGIDRIESVRHPRLEENGKVRRSREPSGTGPTFDGESCGQARCCSARSTYFAVLLPALRAMFGFARAR